MTEPATQTDEPAQSRAFEGPPGTRDFPGPRAAFLLYVLLTLALTWPLVPRVATHLPGGDNDLWQNVWNFWWWRTSILDRGESPYATDLLYQPSSVSLAFHTHSEASILSTFPVLAVFGPTAALNVATLLGFLLAALGGYFLAREVTGSAKGAFVGGVVLGFFPHHVEQSLEHLNLASYQAMPFFLYFLLRTLRRGNPADTLLTGAFFALNCLYSWHNGLLILPLGAWIAAWGLACPKRPRGAIVRDLSLAGAAATILVLPFLWPMLREILAGSADWLKPPVKKGIDPLFLFVPPAEHPFWGSATRGLYEGMKTYAAVGFTSYLGLGALALVAAGGIAAGKSRRRGPEAIEGASALPSFGTWLLWSGAGLVFLVLAFGDPLVLAGLETGIRMPFALVRDLPVWKTLRVANRFLVPAQIALGVLAAWGTAAILARTKPRHRSRAFWGILLVVALDYLAVPYPTRPVPRPEWTRAIARCAPGSVLDIPGSYQARESEDMYFQTLHRRPLVGGYTSCLPEAMRERVRENPFLGLVFEGRPAPALVESLEDPRALEEATRSTLERLRVGVVVLHEARVREEIERRRTEVRGTSEERLHNPEKGIPRETLERIEAMMRGLWGPPCYEDVEVKVFGRPL